MATEAAPDAAGLSVQKLFRNFLEEYREDEDEPAAAPAGAAGDDEVAPASAQQRPVYVVALDGLRDAGTTTLHVNFTHLVECAVGGSELRLAPRICMLARSPTAPRLAPQV